MIYRFKKKVLRRQIH